MFILHYADGVTNYDVAGLMQKGGREWWWVAGQGWTDGGKCLPELSYERSPSSI